MTKNKNSGKFLLLSLLLDVYLYRGILWLFPNATQAFLTIWYVAYAIITLFIIVYLWRFYFNRKHYNAKFQNVYTTSIAYYFVSKLIFLFAVVLVDILSLSVNISSSSAQGIMLIGIIIAIIPLLLILYGVFWGAHFFKINYVDVPIQNLPAAFEDFTIGQISDMHLGSFFRKTDVGNGIEKLMAINPDIIVFTGDLVNFSSEETQGYEVLLSQLSASYGIYAILGNHDYAMYRKDWSSDKERSNDVANLKLFYQLIGWDVLLNESRVIEKDGETLQLIGVENWGKHFQQFGDLNQALKNTEDSAVKILLTHDPSHWEEQVMDKKQDIQLTLSGHTHGFQMGVEYRNLKISPAGIKHKRWAGLYQNKNQYLYINRGFGYLGFPGRIGMRPEITVLKLVRRPSENQ